MAMVALYIFDHTMYMIIEFCVESHLQLFSLMKETYFVFESALTRCNFLLSSG